VDSGRLALRDPHADALRGIRPLWATYAPGPWATKARDEIPVAAGSGGRDTPVRGRRRRVNQSALRLQVTAERTALMLSDELPGILDHWRHPPRKHSSGVRTKGGYDTMNKVPAIAIHSKPRRMASMMSS
jgi:hypothetical protein